jgi:predicted lipoprotein with Yx(FWY)xxD motif
MTTLFRRLWSVAAAAVLTMGVVAGSFIAASPVRAAQISCNTPVTAAATGPTTVSAATTAFGKVLVVGSGQYAGCSLYLLTSDRVHPRNPARSHFACSDRPNPTGGACDTVLWPAILTDGGPIAGPGVKQKLLGTVTRTDLPGLPAVDQVTYAGQPLYRFFLDEAPGETDGANLFDPVTTPTGIWYLVGPHHGRPAPGRAELQFETAQVDGSGRDATVLGASMNHGFELLPDGTFPVYTLSRDRQQGRHAWRHDRDDGRRGPAVKSSCLGRCAGVWLPVLTSGRPEAGPGVHQRAIGTIKRPDGTRQVTYRGHPLYLFVADAYIPGFPYNDGVATINGAGAHTPWGVFRTIPA